MVIVTLATSDYVSLDELQALLQVVHRLQQALVATTAHWVLQFPYIGS